MNVDKLCINSLVLEQITKLNKFERKEVIVHLLRTRTERELGKELNVPHSTIHDWKSLRQDNTKENIHLGFSRFKEKIINMQNLCPRDYLFAKVIKIELERLITNYEVKKGGKSTETNA